MPSRPTSSEDGPAREHERVVVYVPKDQHAKLKAKLAARGQSVSWWFRDMMQRFLRGG